MATYRTYFLRLAEISGAFVFLIFLTIACQPVDVSPTSVMPIPAATKGDWVIVDSSVNKAQIAQGAEVYRLVCSACHAYDGTGLTDQWRATWGEQDQNCWKSKCHASNHPPDGFMLPMSPAIVGPGMPMRFKTAQDLYSYIHISMPWYAPNSLTEEKAWAVTVYVMVLNGMTPPENLDSTNAEQIAIFSTKTIDPALKLSIPPGNQK